MKNVFSFLFLTGMFVCSSSFAASNNINQDPLSYMIHQAKSEQCQPNRVSAKVVKGTIEGLGEVTVVALPMEGCGGGNNWGTSIEAFYQGKHVNLDGAKMVESISIEHNQVIIKTTVQGDDDPDCCPTKHVKTIYSVVSGKLKAKK